MPSDIFLTTLNFMALLTIQQILQWHYIIVLFRLCLHYFYSPFSITDNSCFEIFPTNATTCVGDVARFTCSTTILDSRLFWFVNNKPVNALPLEYQATSTSKRGSESTLLLLSQEVTNNSEVLCAIAPSHRISIFSEPVFLTGRSVMIHDMHDVDGLTCHHYY